MITIIILCITLLFSRQETCTVDRQEWPGRTGEMIVYCDEGQAFDLDTGLSNRAVPNSTAAVIRSYERGESSIVLDFGGELFSAWEL